MLLGGKNVFSDSVGDMHVCVCVFMFVYSQAQR